MHEVREQTTLNDRDGKQIGGCLAGGRRWTAKGCEEAFWGDENVLCLNCGGGYTPVYL